MKSFFATVVVVLLLASPVLGQQRGQRPGGQRPGGQRMGGQGPGGQRGSTPGTPGSSTLERFGLKVGQAMPDLTVHDAAGDDFRVADLKGKHTVIVFGCLT